MGEEAERNISRGLKIITQNMRRRFSPKNSGREKVMKKNDALSLNAAHKENNKVENKRHGNII